jgi:hypothetical protein
MSFSNPHEPFFLTELNCSQYNNHQGKSIFLRQSKALLRVGSHIIVCFSSLLSFGLGFDLKEITETHAT